MEFVNLPTGWLEGQIASTKAEIATWPAWLRSQLDEGDTPLSDCDAFHLGHLFENDMIRAELRIIGVGRVGVMVKGRSGDEWIVLREVKTVGDVRRLCEALGHKIEKEGV